MKKIYLLLLLLPLGLMAQIQRPERDMMIKQLLAKQLEKNGHQKANDINWRIMAENRELYSAGLWNEFDSIAYEYDTLDLVSQETNFEWDAGTSTFGYANRTVNTYNAAGELLSTTYQNFDGTVFVNSNRYIFTYDANGNPITLQQDNWDGANWVLYSRSQYTYGTYGEETMTQQIYDAGSMTWNNVSRTITTYNANGVPEIITELQWVSGAWQNSSKDTITYNAQGKETVRVRQFWTSGAWENVYDYTNVYDANGNNTSFTGRQWVSGAWQNFYRYLNTYTASNELETYTSEDWVSGAWEKQYRQVFTYVSAEILESVTNQDWVSGAWVNTAEYDYTYDANDNQSTVVISSWDGSAWVPSSRNFYYYESYEAVGIDAPLAGKEASVYPNPFAGAITLKFGATASGQASLNLYDITGKLAATQAVQTVVGDNQLVLDGTALQAGIYFYQLTAGSSVLKGKVLKQ
ncbi:MAG: T9SS type A sorting domain-containing protein [Chitinophagales bacterium]|nr:T9SS type A sorting domain-containing protein [Chitinophagales bacterium]